MCPWDFDVDEPVPAAPRRSSIAADANINAQRAAAGDSLQLLVLRSSSEAAITAAVPAHPLAYTAAREHCFD
jgi:hypothetical protein